MEKSLLDDQPIQSIKQDLLNRKSFIENIAQYLLNYENPNSIVLGLEGSWGYGKTSAINLIKEYIIQDLKKKEIQNVFILCFNPWGFSEKFDIYVSFFSELIKVLEKIKMKKLRNKLIKKLKKYLRILIGNLDIILDFTPFSSFKNVYNRIKNKILKEKEEPTYSVDTLYT